MSKTIILLEDIDFGMTEVQLAHITKMHNDGYNDRAIAKAVNRTRMEVVIALLHQVKERVYLRPFAYTVPSRCDDGTNNHL